MKIKVLNYAGVSKVFDIPDDVYMLRVTVMTGDEIVEVYRWDDNMGCSYLYETIDWNDDDRTKDCLDTTYYVHYSDIERWSQRDRSSLNCFANYGAPDEQFSISRIDFEYEKGL